jgi:hypothetical protein
MERLVAPRRRGDRVHILHAERGLDDVLETDPLLDALRRLELRHQHVERVDVGGGADLGDHDQIELPRRALEHIDDIAIHVMRVETVDAQRQDLAAPIDVVEPGDDVLARLLLLVGRHRVLEIEEDDVGRALCRLLEEMRLAAGHGKLAAVQTLRRVLDDREAHAFLAEMCRRRISEPAAKCNSDCDGAITSAKVSNARKCAVIPLLCPWFFSAFAV